ncbi:MAG: PAS domain S-box protein [Bacteroidales bacterium]|nr:PAS domain S-box protein [Bacteroidales bacterium]
MEDLNKYSKDQLIRKIELLQKERIDFTESEEKYKAMFESAPLSYQSLDIYGNFIDVNPMWLKTFGYEREEVIGKWFGDFLRPDFVDHFKKNFPEFKKRGYVNDVQFYMLKKNREEIYTSFEGCIGYTPEGKFKQTYCVIKDITKEYETEVALKESEQNLKSAQSVAKIGNWLIDVKNNKLKWSDETYNIFGVSKDKELSYSDFLELVYPEDREATNEAWNEALKTGEYNIEHRIEVNGKMKWIQEIAKLEFNENKEVTFCLGIAQDITGRKISENKLLYEKEFSEKIIETNNAIVVGLDKNHIIQIFNNGAEKITGYSKSEVIGKDWFEIFFPTKMVDEMNKVWKESWGSASHSYINPILSKTGDERIISWQTTGLYHEEDKKKHLMISIGEDITERKETEFALLESEEKFRSVLENIQLIGLMLDKNADIIFANNFLLKITGWKREEIIGKNWFDYFIPKELNQEVKKIFKVIIKSGEFPNLHENDILTKAGKTLTIKWSNTTHFNSENNPVAITSIGEDVMEKNKAILDLKESEEKFRSLVKSMNDLVFVFDEQKRFIYYHLPKSEILYINSDNFIGKTHSEVMPPYINDLFENAFKKIKTGQTAGYEYHMEIEDELKWYSLNLSPVIKEGKFSGVIAVARNITKRKQAEETLKESKRNLQKILDTVPLGIGLITDRKLGWSNDRMHEMLGYPKGGLIGISSRLIYENEDEYNRAGKIAYEMMMKEGIGEVETQWQRKDNSLFDCLIRITPLNLSNPSEGNIAVISDISGRKQVEAELKKHREILEDLVQERTDELEKSLENVERMNELFVGREFRIKELRDKVEELEKRRE